MHSNRKQEDSRQINSDNGDVTVDDVDKSDRNKADIDNRDRVDDNDDMIINEDDSLAIDSDLDIDSLAISEAHTVLTADAGQRIDKLAAALWPEQSRAQIQHWLKSENLQVNGEAVKAKYRVKEGDSIELDAVLEQHSSDKPENIDLDVIYEDESVVVINKPVGMVVHPGAGNWSGTLVNALLYHYPNQAHLPRAGLVHRIDKDTSGLLVIGKTKAAQLQLQAQLKDKSVYRHYRCVVAGNAASLTRQRLINAPIARHRVQRTKMTVHNSGKEAITHLVEITPLSEMYSLVDVNLETGRTHQIRVHLSHIGHPIVGDNVYGNRQQLRAGISEQKRQAVLAFPRQALHAYRLGFVHPQTNETIELTAPMPDDILALIALLSDQEE